MTSNDTNEIDSAGQSGGQDLPAATPRSPIRAAAASLRGHGRIARALVLVAAVAVIGSAYVVGAPPAAGTGTAGNQPAGRLSVAHPAASAGTQQAFASDQKSFSGNSSTSDGGAPTGGQTTPLAAVETTQIVKTGQMSLEVSGLDSALNEAQAVIAGLGGKVDSSNRSGAGDYATASMTFRVPVEKWDEALSDLRKIGSKVLSEQTDATDVTLQVLDLGARLDNLKATEIALQSIMARATVIADVLAVETQLSQTQGEIESLTAQRDHLKGQAAMSTLTAYFQLPAKTVIAQATQEWTLSGQIDEAGAALVRIGQGLATIVVYICVVVLPVGLAILILFGLLSVARRILRRGRGRNAVAAA